MTDDYESDIPLDVARAAHRGTSHDPDARGAQERANYARALRTAHESFAKLAEGKEEILAREFERYRAEYRTRYVAVLAAKSQCVSTMITGPSNFPTARARKASDRVDKRERELIEWRKRANVAICRQLAPEEGPIASGDSDAVERLEARVTELRLMRERMISANKLIRAHARRGLQAQVAALVGVGYAFDVAAALLKPDSLGRIGYADYQLANTRAELTRLEKRLEAVRAAKATPVEEIAPGADGTRVEVDASANRVRIFFPGRPDATTITALKSHAFRWTPSLGCWQAYVNPRAVSFARTTAAA